jgi:hypothetical protein
VTVAAPAPVAAWEPATTHAGLTEQSAFAARLHQVLIQQFGLERGLLGQLRVPATDAPALFAALRRLNPSHGYVPDQRGQLTAVGWLVAGAVLADLPTRHALDHFYDPVRRAPLSGRTSGGLVAGAQRSLFAGIDLDRTIAAPDWVVHRDNPMNHAGFVAQYAQAVAARTPLERQRHLAGALLAAGAILHVLQDLGSPSHVRDDLGAHLERVSNLGEDRGSRFERVAALAYGRVGVPAPAPPVSRRSLRDFFSAADGKGLADVTSASWFSTRTLPRPAPLRPTDPDPYAERPDRYLRRALPTPGSLDRLSAAQTTGATARNRAGVCLARYRLATGHVSFWLDDDCLLEQSAAILPQVGAYSAGLLAWLFRGQLQIATSGSGLQVTGKTVGKGTLEIYWDDARGVRSRFHTVDVAGAGGTALATVPAPPEGARALAVLFRGVDANGQPLIAAASTVYPLAPPVAATSAP